MPGRAVCGHAVDASRYRDVRGEDGAAVSFVRGAGGRAVLAAASDAVVFRFMGWIGR